MAGLNYMKKYIHKLKQKRDQFYVLKCDIHKYFYSIDHDILLQQLDMAYEDKDIVELLKTVIQSTDCTYINEVINKKKSKEYDKLINSKLTNKEKTNKIKALENVPLYKKGKWLPIGNMSSQIFAIFYLNQLDHFIKKKLKIKYYIRYMDDFILFHEQKEYLEYCLIEIKKELEKLQLHLNHKTEISEIHHGVNFLGYRFLLRNKKLIIKISKKNKRKIIKEMKNCSFKEREFILKKYHSHLKHAHSKGWFYQIKYCRIKS